MTDEEVNETLFVGADMVACAVTALSRRFVGKHYVDDDFVREVHEIGSAEYGPDWDWQMKKLAVAWWLKSGISEPEEQEATRPC